MPPPDPVPPAAAIPLDPDDSDPDAPLLRAAWTKSHRLEDRLPKWLLPRQSRLQKTLCAGASLLVALLKRRLTWRYVLVAAPALYMFVCLVLLRTPPFACPLPAYTGPHAVGTVDLEIPLPVPRLVSDSVFREDGSPAFELQTVLFTLYYPAEMRSGSKSPIRRHHWIPKPVALTARGFARFARLDNFLARPVLTLALWAVAGGVTIPAEVDTPLLADGLPEKLPLVVFSHGMASSRTDYTHYLGELASRGAIVAAVEHRDGSCPGSLIVKPTATQQRLHFREPDLLLANKSVMSTPQLKREQLAFRDAEIAATISAMHALHHNEPLASTRPEGRHLDSFARRIHMAKLIIAGHSYGATGALQFLKQSSSSSSSAETTPPPAAAIILDPGKESGPLNDQVDVPVLIINSNSWSRTHSLFFGRPHFDTVRDIARGVLTRARAAWFLTSLRTSHPSVTDAPLLEPLLLSWTTGAGLDTRAALAEYVGASHDFIRFVVDGKPRGILAQEVTHTEYDKWVDDDRKTSYPDDLAKLWQVHVSPASLNKQSDSI